MRIESSVTSVSWIPSEAKSGMFRMPMDLGIGHYDDPLPDVLDDLEALRAAGLGTRRNVPVKVLGSGELTKRLTVHAHGFSKTARERIEAAGGSCQLIES